MTVDDESTAESLRRYLANQVNTSSPVQRLLMLFDQLRRDLHLAALALEGSDLKEVSDNLVHAQQIICALRDPLDVATDLGQSLSSVYDFCLKRLVEANLRKDASLLPAVQRLVDQLAAANRTAAAAMTAGLEAVGAS